MATRRNSYQGSTSSERSSPNTSWATPSSKAATSRAGDGGHDVPAATARDAIGDPLLTSVPLRRSLRMKRSMAGNERTVEFLPLVAVAELAGG